MKRNNVLVVCAIAVLLVLGVAFFGAKFLKSDQEVGKMPPLKTQTSVSQPTSEPAKPAEPPKPKEIDILTAVIKPEDFTTNINNRLPFYVR